MGCPLAKPGPHILVLGARTAAASLPRFGRGERTDTPVPPWGRAGAPLASGRRVRKVQAGAWRVTAAAVVAPDVSLPSRSHRRCLRAGAEQSRDQLWRDGRRGGKEPERRCQLSGAVSSATAVPAPLSSAGGPGRGWHWDGVPGSSEELAPCPSVTLHWTRVPPQPVLGTHEGCHPVLAQVSH